MTSLKWIPSVMGQFWFRLWLSGNKATGNSLNQCGSRSVTSPNVTWPHSLNISKHASNTCIYKELKRCPVTHRAWAMAIKYWIRLNSGTENCFLNEAYKMSQAENHHWLQSIHYLLNMHGFRDIYWTTHQSRVIHSINLLNYGRLTHSIKVW